MKGKTHLISSLTKEDQLPDALILDVGPPFLGMGLSEILGRELDEEGRKFFTNLLSLGFSRWEIILSLIRSEEFIKKTKREHSELDSRSNFFEKNISPSF